MSPRPMIADHKTAFAATADRSPPRRPLRARPWVVRLVTLWGAAGAVLVQSAVFALVARLALQLDSSALPGLAVSVIGLALGALAMMGSKSLVAGSLHAA
jgi:hypothetical protein